MSHCHEPMDFTIYDYDTGRAVEGQKSICICETHIIHVCWYNDAFDYLYWTPQLRIIEWP